MKFIKIKQEELSALFTILESAPNGADIGEVRKAIRIMDKLEEVKDLLVLEDSEYEYLIHRFNTTKFVRITKDVVDLADRLESAVSINPAD